MRVHPYMVFYTVPKDGTRSSVIGAMDCDVWNATDPEDQSKIMQRWIKDAGLRKADAKHMDFGRAVRDRGRTHAPTIIDPWA